jgi:hypothetical protein
MSVDTPARIVIIGAGPVGIEAALYARYLGYEVTLFEQRTVCENFLQQSTSLLPGSAGENRTSLGLAALRAQHEDYPPFDPTAQETRRELADRYLLPLAATDLVSDGLRLGHTVLRIERTDFPDEVDAEQQRIDSDAQDAAEDDGEYEEFEELDYAPFELLVRQSDGTEITVQAEVVIDASGSSNSAPIILNALRIEPEVDSSVGGNSGEQAEFQTFEPNFYRLGSKSVTGSEAITIAAGHDQIRRLFAIVGGRSTLNLYSTFKSA